MRAALCIQLNYSQWPPVCQLSSSDLVLRLDFSRFSSSEVASKGVRFLVVSRLSRARDLLLGTFQSSSEAPSDLLEWPFGKNSNVFFAQLAKLKLNWSALVKLGRCPHGFSL